MISSRVLASVVGAYAVAAVLVAPRVTHADPIAQAPTVAVRLADLNLDARSGVAQGFQRIRIAAHEVCQDYAPNGTLLPSAAYQACVREAVSAAVRKVGSPLLTAYYDERSGQHALNTASR